MDAVVIALVIVMVGLAIVGDFRLIECHPFARIGMS